MDPSKKEHSIKYFRIESLFGTSDVEIPFDKNFKILIGENGLGKTSILNALYYTLTGKFSKLNSLIFKRIIIEFDNGKKVEIDKKDLTLTDEDDKFKFRQETIISDLISQFLLDTEKSEISNSIINDDENARQIITKIASRLVKQIGYPTHIIKRNLLLMFSGNYGKLEEARRLILNEVDAEIMYFPTYRRIEEELNKLGSIDEIKLPLDDKRLIQFGMEDVNMTLNKVIESIKNSAIFGFSEITGEMLSQYLSGIPKLDEDIQAKIAPDILKIILERVGENISEENKKSIIELVESKAIFEKDQYKHLLNFLSKLVKIYDQQKAIDNSIKDFENICNGYLNNKKVIYNESKVTINIVQDRNQKTILLKNLSSGEKQIISLFAKILFDDSRKIIVLFDEPELSLSIEWQRKLLPDLLKAKNCNLLLSVTHSPFIFDNKLDEYAEDMGKYVKESAEPVEPSGKI